jgi:hypothetical protein
MLKKLLCIGVVVALVGASADADIFTTWEQGALRMKLRIDQPTGNAWLSNLNNAIGPGSPTTLPYDIDGYSIYSTGGWLAPTLVWNADPTLLTGWLAIQNAISKKTVETILVLGEYVMGFARMSQTATNLTEANASGDAYFIADGTKPLNYEWWIGKPVQAGKATLADLKWYYRTPGAGGNMALGVLEIPEPATMSLLAIGGVALLLRKKHRR